VENPKNMHAIYKKSTIFVQFCSNFEDLTYPLKDQSLKVWAKSDKNCGFFINSILFGFSTFLWIGPYIHRPFSDTAAVFVGCLQYIWSFSGKDSLFLYILFWNNECEPKNIVWSMILLSKMFTEKSVVHWNWVRTKECKLRQITVAIFIAKIPWNQRIFLLLLHFVVFSRIMFPSE